MTLGYDCKGKTDGNYPDPTEQCSAIYITCDGGEDYVRDCPPRMKYESSTDMCLEPAYVPALEAAGYVLRIREPDWYEHRMFKGPDTDINLHVYSSGCPEIDRYLLFRDWLRSNASDRLLYERTKRELARKDWKYTQNYADAKTSVVEEIIARARGDSEEEAREND